MKFFLLFNQSNIAFKGDSGGSLYVKDTIKNKTKYISAGIVSYGDGCAQVYKPG